MVSSRRPWNSPHSSRIFWRFTSSRYIDPVVGARGAEELDSHGEKKRERRPACKRLLTPRATLQLPIAAWSITLPA